MKSGSDVAAVVVGAADRVGAAGRFTGPVDVRRRARRRQQRAGERQQQGERRASEGHLRVPRSSLTASRLTARAARRGPPARLRDALGFERTSGRAARQWTEDPNHRGPESRRGPRDGRAGARRGRDRAAVRPAGRAVAAGAVRDRLVDLVRGRCGRGAATARQPDGRDHGRGRLRLARRRPGERDRPGAVGGRPRRPAAAAGARRPPAARLSPRVACAAPPAARSSPASTRPPCCCTLPPTCSRRATRPRRCRSPTGPTSSRSARRCRTPSAAR